MSASSIDLHEDGASFYDDYPDVDRHSCRLLGPTALVVQALMGVLVILSLVYKRHREKPMRPWRIWLFDVSKQIVGQMFVHGVNVLISDLVANNSSGNACVFYFLNIFVDTTLGVGMIYLILHIATHVLTQKMQLKGFESGQYGTPPSFQYWLRQAAVYVFSLTTMKLLVIGLFALWPGIFKLGEWLLSWTYTGDGDGLQVIFTMGLFPIIMNVLQFWLIDSIVKASTKSFAVALPDSQQEPLFVDDEDDDDDDRPRYDIENPRPPSRSTDRTFVRDKFTDHSIPEGAKNSGSTLGMNPDSIAMHAYPPSVASTSRSPPTPPTSTSPKPRKLTRRRSPPPPLHLRSPNTITPAIHQPKPLRATRGSNPAHGGNGSTEVHKDWAESWDDSEDWANRVGEEEWTGRRIEQKKDVLGATWDDSLASVPIGS